MSAMAAMLLLPLLLSAMIKASVAGGEQETHIKVLARRSERAGPDDGEGGAGCDDQRGNASKTLFGSVVVIDDPLTEGPDLSSSRLVGRAQGTYVSAGKDVPAVAMAMSFVFQGGSRYNGSSVSIMGRNEVSAAVREMAVVGGTGVFRWARGYAQTRTHAFNLTTGDATVEYSLFIRH